MCGQTKFALPSTTTAIAFIEYFGKTNCISSRKEFPIFN